MRYLRQVFLVPVWMVVTFIIILLGIYITLDLVPEVFLASLDIQPGYMDLEGFREGRRRVVLFFFLSGAAVYAVIRVGRSHPAFDRRYCRWLASTPWTYAKPLPLGPVHIVWQDAVVVLLLMLLAWWRTMADPLYVAIAFGGAYALTMVPMLMSGKAEGWGILILLVTPLLTALGLHSPWILLVVTVMVVFAHFGLRDSLRRFPWPDDPPAPNRNVGWPFARIGPLRTESLEPGTGIAAGIIAAWAVGWAAWLLSDQEHIRLELVAMLLWGLFGAAISSLIRIAVYCGGYLPSTSLRGRVGSGQWIIPGYDKVFITPIILLATGLIVPIIIHLLALPVWAFLALLAAVLTVVGFEFPPRLSRWRLTGAHRITHGLSRTTHTRL